MTNRIRVQLTALLLAGTTLTGACDSFLSGPGIDENPNVPTSASRDNLFVGVQSVQFANFEGFIARLTSMWTQQLAGVERQHFAYGIYDYTEDDISTEWSAYYAGGGLRDIRLVQETALQAGDSLYGGIAKVLEALVMSQVAAQWGDIPFSDAGNLAGAALDTQEQVFNSLQAKLDTAIVWISRTSASNVGPRGADFVYAGSRAKWTQAAHSIKARIHLYTAERKGSAAYQAAYDQATLGISTAVNDLKTAHGAPSNESNFWHQFQYISRTGDVLAGRYLVDLLKSRAGENRLEGYFLAWDGCDVEGADPGVGTGACTSDINSPDGEERLAPDFRQPWLTYEENELIIAEAAFRIGKPLAGPDVLGKVNNIRGRHGVAALADMGPNPLRTIMIEKYIVLFQNPEVWSDYKRTCQPDNLTRVAGTTQLPARLLYGFAERNANPNIPDVSVQKANPRNWNDPTGC